MSWPLVAFVDSVSTAATVRLDLSTTNAYVRSDGFDLGNPTLAGDPDTPNAEYGTRRLAFDVRVKGTKTVALAVLSSIAKELQRRRNWLQVQLTAFHQPVWFLTYRTAPGSLSFDLVVADPTTVDQWLIHVDLDAAPFAYGARIDQPMQQVNNDPAAGTLACFMRMVTVQGDMPAPARVRIRYTTAQSGYRHMVATSPMPASYTAPIVWPVGGTDGWTAGTDTGASTSDAVMSGGTYRPVTFATTTALTNRLTGTAPTTVPPGRYKVLVRVARSDTTSTFSFRFGITIGFLYGYGRTVAATWTASAAAKHAAWVDLGTFNIPNGVALEDMTAEAPVSPVVALQVARTSGTGAVWLDAFLLVPVGDENARVLFVDYPGLGPSSVLTDEYHDADEGQVYSRDNTTGALKSMLAPVLSGGFPVLVPGANNVLHFVEQTSLDRGTANGIDIPDRIATDAQIVVSYYPRWLNLAAS